MASKKKVQEINFGLFQKQLTALQALSNPEVREVCYGGAAGGGKSVIGCVWILSLCIKYPGIRCLIGRHQLSDLKKTTILTLFEVLNDKWKINPKLYNYNQQDHILKFNNGSEILFVDLAHKPSDPQYTRLGGIECTAIFVDEANQISIKAYNILKSRIRFKLEEFKLTPKILITCNPNRGWIYEMFYKLYASECLPSERLFIPATVDDNITIGKQYIKQLESLDELSVRRLRYGDWNYTDELTLFDLDSIYSMFDSEREYDFTGSTEYYLSVDGARLGKDSSVLMVWENLNVVEIHTIGSSTVDVLLNKVKELQLIHNIPTGNIVADSDGNGSWVDFLPGCYKFVNNASAINQENYKNVRAQLYYLLAKQVNERKIKVYSNNLEIKNLLASDLINIKAKNIDKDLKRQIVSKEEIKKVNGGRSTDYSDAMMMRMIYLIKPTDSKVQPSYEYLTRVGTFRKR